MLVVPRLHRVPLGACNIHHAPPGFDRVRVCAESPTADSRRHPATAQPEPRLSGRAITDAVDARCAPFREPRSTVFALGFFRVFWNVLHIRARHLLEQNLLAPYIARPFASAGEKIASRPVFVIPCPPRYRRLTAPGPLTSLRCATRNDAPVARSGARRAPWPPRQTVAMPVLSPAFHRRRLPARISPRQSP